MGSPTSSSAAEPARPVLAQPSDRDASPSGHKPLTERPSFLAHKIGLLLLGAAEARLAELGLSARTYFVLASINSPDPPSQRHLSRILAIDPTLVVALIDEMQTGGLVGRDRDPRDRRRYNLRLTAKGIKTLGRASEAIDGIEAEFFAPLTSRQLTEHHRYLKLLIKDRWPPTGP
jgi:DNA-binding MarR family transcriptional regulator